VGPAQVVGHRACGALEDEVVIAGDGDHVRGRHRLEPSPKLAVEPSRLEGYAVIEGRRDVPGDHEHVARGDGREKSVEVCGRGETQGARRG